MSLTKEDLQAISAMIKKELEPVNKQLDNMDKRLDSIETLIKGSQAEIVAVVEAVGKKTDQIEKALLDTQGATAQNSYELQVLKSKAQ